MAHVYVCDGGGDADGASMYFYFDDKSPKAVAFMEELLASRSEQEGAAALRFRNLFRPAGSLKTADVALAV